MQFFLWKWSKPIEALTKLFFLKTSQRTAAAGKSGSVISARRGKNVY
jgi:hypothetical protein